MTTGRIPTPEMTRRILDATCTQLLAVGARRTNLAEIAATLRISKKTLYQHFPTKEELLQAVFRGYRLRAGARHWLFRRAPTALAELQLLLGWFREQHLALPLGFLPVLAREAPVLYEAQQHYQATSLTRLLEHNLARGQAEGIYRLLSAPVLSRWYMGLLGKLLHDQLTPDFSRTRQHQVLGELFLRSISLG